MEQGTHNPGGGAAAAHRPQVYGDLRKRNERRARVARLLDARRERQTRVQRIIPVQRAHRQP